ncbi:MAG: ATP phosphoribosyltransferase regulatory subunit, partial [Rhodospirillaceae bacterium]
MPVGLRDVLPPDAAFEAKVIESLVGFFTANGYDLVSPPLIEFEETLLSGSGATTAAQVFRLMDPVSQRMMGVRADMTPQVARIAVTRLVNAPRPLRLGYAGPVLRVKGTQLRPERQSIQAGVELIGSAQPHADAEVALLIAEALAELGVTGVSVDLNLPTLVPTVLADLDVKQEKAERLRRALDHKDTTAIAAEEGRTAYLLGALVAASGPADRAVDALARLDLPPAAA